MIGLCKTWVEIKGWENLRRKMSKNFIWRCQYATRKNKKGRAKSRIITGVRKGIEEVEETKKTDVNGIQKRRLKVKRKILGGY